MTALDLHPIISDLNDYLTLNRQPTVSPTDLANASANLNNHTPALIAEIACLRAEVSDAHTHYMEAAHRGWREKAHADGQDVDAVRLAARLAGLAAMNPTPAVTG